MADMYTEFSEVIPRLTKEEEVWLKEQLEIVYVFDGKEYTDATLPKERSSDEADWVGCGVFRDVEDYDCSAGADAGFQYEFCDSDDKDTGRYLWLYAQDWGYVDNVVHLVRKFLGTFRSNDCWSLTWSTTCSKPRAGEFGGGAVFVTAERVEHQDTWAFIERQREAFASSKTTDSSTCRQVLQDLLDCAELNLDKIENSTRQAICRARALLQGEIDAEGTGTSDPCGTWECHECGWTTEVGYTRLAESGTPLCAECDVEMALLNARKFPEAVEHGTEDGKTRTLLTVEVDYDAEITDPESLASAADLLMETACSTPGVLNEYGNPTFGEFIVACHSYSLNIGGPELRQQRELLQHLQGAARAQMPYWLTDGEAESLEGLVNLTDEIADQAHDRHGVNCLLRKGVEPCDCEKPGHFRSGVPGILAHLKNGRLTPGAKVERCDLCQRYPSDEAALERLRELGHGPS